MFNEITYEKVEEVIGLVREAADEPPRDPTVADRYPVTHEPPLRPQPDAGSWGEAFCRYLADMPDGALAELEALYRFGAGEFADMEAAVAAVGNRKVSKSERIAFLDSRLNLVSALEAALRAR